MSQWAGNFWKGYDKLKNPDQTMNDKREEPGSGSQQKDRTYKGVIPMNQDELSEWSNLLVQTEKMKKLLEEQPPDEDEQLPKDGNLKIWVGFMKDLVNSAADWIDCGPPDPQYAKHPEIHRKQQHIASNFRDLVQQCDPEDFKWALQIVLEAINVLKNHNVKSTAMDHIKTVLTDGAMDDKLHNFRHIVQLLLADDKQPIPMHQLVRKLNLAEVSDSGRAIGENNSGRDARRIQKMKNQILKDGISGRSGKGVSNSVFADISSTTIAGGTWKDIANELEKLVKSKTPQELKFVNVCSPQHALQWLSR